MERWKQAASDCVWLMELIATAMSTLVFRILVSSAVESLLGHSLTPKVLLAVQHSPCLIGETVFDVLSVMVMELGMSVLSAR